MLKPMINVTSAESVVDVLRKIDDQARKLVVLMDQDPVKTANLRKSIEMKIKYHAVI